MLDDINETDLDWCHNVSITIYRLEIKYFPIKCKMINCIQNQRMLNYEVLYQIQKMLTRSQTRD